MSMSKIKPQKYSVEWDCPECGNSHKWWWDEKWEAHSEDACVMKCDRCEAETWCQGDGHGFYEPIKDEKKRIEELESLELDLHNYVRGLEDKVNAETKTLYDAVNSLAKHIMRVEETVNEQRGELDNLGRRTTEVELNIWRLENGVKTIKANDPLDLTPKVDLNAGTKAQETSFLELIHGVKPPFHERLREGCQLEGVSNETVAKIIRFVAVEVERMTERDMGGSFTVSNLEVARQLRNFAEIADIPF